MFKKLAVVFTAAVVVVSLSACGKKTEEQKQPAGGKPGAELMLPQKGQEPVVTVPADVKGKWKAVKLKVENKKSKDIKEITINLGESKDIPGTKLSVKAVEFLPSFNMQGLNITSASNEPSNPAARVVISEGGKEVWKGWLFQKYPTTHAFTHPDVSVTLAEGLKS